VRHNHECGDAGALINMHPSRQPQSHASTHRHSPKLGKVSQNHQIAKLAVMMQNCLLKAEGYSFTYLYSF
jgi:hypothetical protein